MVARISANKFLILRSSELWDGRLVDQFLTCTLLHIQKPVSSRHRFMDFFPRSLRPFSGPLWVVRAPRLQRLKNERSSLRFSVPCCGCLDFGQFSILSRILRSIYRIVCSRHSAAIARNSANAIRSIGLIVSGSQRSLRLLPYASSICGIGALAGLVTSSCLLLVVASSVGEFRNCCLSLTCKTPCSESSCTRKAI